MFHVTENLFFGRTSGGAVRVVKFASAPIEPLDVNKAERHADAVLDMVLPEASWASVVASVSRGDELDGRYYTALAFHQSTGAVDLVAYLGAVRS